MMKHKLIIPTVHMGGTDKETLLAARRTFSDALYKAGRALGAMFPNARDYRECIGGDMVPTFSEAVEQHTRRVSMFLDLQLEIEREQEVIFDS